MRHHIVDYRDLTILSAFYDVRGIRAEMLSQKTDPECKRDVQDAIRRYIIPKIEAVESRAPGFTGRLLHTLKYYLLHRSFPIEEVYSAEDPLFKLPGLPIGYYFWAFEAIFPQEEVTMCAEDSYEEARDISPI